MEMTLLTKAVIDTLRKYADDLESGNTHISGEDGLGLISQIAHINLTKQQVADRYGVSPKTIERREKDGIFPLSHPTQVTKKNWYLDELIKFELDNQLASH